MQLQIALKFSQLVNQPERGQKVAHRRKTSESLKAEKGEIFITYRQNKKQIFLHYCRSGIALLKPG